MVVADHRYVVCRNPAEAAKDAVAREAVLAKLEDALAHGPKSVIGNKGFARFLKIDKDAVTIDRQAVERDQRLDGKFVLRTSTDLLAEEVALAYKSLWRVERALRETKHRLEVRLSLSSPRRHDGRAHRRLLLGLAARGRPSAPARCRGSGELLARPHARPS